MAENSNKICICDWAFECCDKLTDVIIPESVSEIGKHAFSRCVNLQNISGLRKDKKP